MSEPIGSATTGKSDYKEVMLGPKSVQVPVSWSVEKIGSSNISNKIKAGGTPKATNEEYYGGDIKYVKIEDMSSAGKYIQTTTNHLTQEGLNSTSTWLVPEDSLLLSMYGSYGKVAITRDEMATNQAILGIIPSNSINLDYLYYASSRLKPYFESVVLETTQANLNKGIVENTPILSPPLPEQRRIADILSTVDKQIEQTEDIIHEKQELRKGLISELIRTGLDSHTPVSKRIGPKEYSIADGWELCEVSQLSTDEKKAIRGGPSGTQLKGAEYGTDGVKVYGQEHVSANDFSLGDKHLAKGEFSDFESVEILPNDVLVTMMGTVGDSAVFPADAKRGIMDSHLLRIRPNLQTVIPEFLAILISESKIVEDQINSLSHGLVMSGLNIGIVESLTVPIPPIDEQQKLVDILSTTSKSIEVERSRLQSLKELKRGLMQDLLTGKVRVNPDN